MTTITAWPPGLWRDEHHRYYYRGHGPFPSVTTITGNLDKSGALVGWAKRETAACAIRNIDMLYNMIGTGGTEAAQAWLSKIPDYIRDQAADLGVRVHALAASEIQGEEISPTGIEVPFVRAYRSFLDEVKPKVILVEAMVINLTRGFGGTLDLGVEIDGKKTLLDIKTGDKIYPETALQLAGYASGEFTATPDDPTPKPLPTWERYGVLHLRPDSWELVPYDVTDESFRCFDSLIDVNTWKKGSGYIMGRPIVSQTQGVAP